MMSDLSEPPGEGAVQASRKQCLGWEHVWFAWITVKRAQGLDAGERERGRMGEHVSGEISQAADHAGLGRHGKDCGVHPESDGNPPQVSHRVHRMNWLTLGITPLDIAWREVRLSSVGEERPVWRLLQSSRWEVMAVYTGVVGVEVMRSLWGYIFTTGPRGCADGLDEMWEKDRHQRQSMVSGQSNCAEKRRFRRETGEFFNGSKLRPIKFVMPIKYWGGAVEWAVLPISQDF